MASPPVHREIHKINFSENIYEINVSKYYEIKTLAFTVKYTRRY